MALELGLKLELDRLSPPATATDAADACLSVLPVGTSRQLRAVAVRVGGVAAGGGPGGNRPLQVLPGGVPGDGVRHHLLLGGEVGRCV